MESGDKNNHVATAHVAQMLYIWPYIAFFSDPLVGPFFLQQVMLDRFLSSSYKLRGKTVSRPGAILLLATISTMLAIVHFNTIVHPFTLADNRHYMFYIFRLLTWSHFIKYLAIPAYFGAAWIVLAALAEQSDSKHLSAKKQKIEKDKDSVHDNSSLEEAYELEAPTVSWVMIWLGTTALNLCTAPLVEPRYCILPWMIWRLHLPIQRYTKLESNAPASQKGKTLHSMHDSRLWRETAWLVAINVITGYIFLYRGFEWKQEPGKIQRFMW